MEYMLKRLTEEEAGAVARRRDMFGITPIKYAVYSTSVEVAELLCPLLNQKALDDAMCTRDRSGATLLHTIATIDPSGVERVLALLSKKGRRKALRVMNRDGNTVGDIMRMDSSSTAHRCTTARYLRHNNTRFYVDEPTTVGML